MSMKRRSFFGLLAALPFALKKVVAAVAATPVPPVTPVIPGGYGLAEGYGLADPNTGYVFYCPYIPLYVTPNVVLPPTPDVTRFAKIFAATRINQSHYLKETIQA
jgi:hypothetical protein